MVLTGELRKVQVTSKDTHLISLPKPWLEKVNVRGGDHVSLTLEPDGSLTIQSAQAAGRRWTGSLDANGLSPASLGHRIEHAYRCGWEAITITGLAALPGHRTAVAVAAQELAGVQVADESEDAVLLRVLVDGTGVTADQALVRLHALALAALDGSHDPSVRPVADVRSEARRLVLLLHRQARRSGRDAVFGLRRGVAPEHSYALATAASALADVVAGGGNPSPSERCPEASASLIEALSLMRRPDEEASSRAAAAANVLLGNAAADGDVCAVRAALASLRLCEAALERAIPAPVRSGAPIVSALEGM